MKPISDSCLPKYQQLADHFRQKLEAGVLRPGDRLPSLAEMQQEYDASRPTVERAHALLEKDGLIVRRHGAGVFVRETQRKRTLATIGLSGKGFSFNGYAAYWAQIMGGVREAASLAQKQLLILDEESHDGWEKADGVLVCDWEANKASRHHLPSLPLVSLLVPIKGVASVYADDYAGARQATQHLLDLGHRRIAFLHSFGEQILLSQRRAGYRDALVAAGIVPLSEWEREIYNWFMYGNQIVSSARQEMSVWLGGSRVQSDHSDLDCLQNSSYDNDWGNNEKCEVRWQETGCTALICQNDETAWGAIQALQAEGIKVPEDVSVVGFDGTDFCEMTSPALTSIEVPLRQIGAVAVKLLLEQIESDAVQSDHKVLPVKLQPRASCAAVKL